MNAEDQLVNVELHSYHLDSVLYKGDPARAHLPIPWEQFAALWPLATNERPASVYSINNGPSRISVQAAMELAALGIIVEVKPLPNAMLVKMQTPERAWSYGETVQPVDLATGRAVQVTIPDMALMMIDEVTWRDDCCTEELQRLLDDGWRLLAVCPPNAQRRPDYILGRRRKP